MTKNKIFNTILSFMIVVAGTIFTACGHTDEPDPQPARFGRTVLVYMVANNNLGSNHMDYDDISQMKKGAAAGGITNGRLILYHAPYNSDPVLVQINEASVDTLRRYDRQQYSVSAERMSRVLADVDRLAPANDYGLVLWSHGTGWLRDGMEETTAEPQSFGDDRGYKMNTSTLASVLEESNMPFSFIYNDCCYMMSVETLYELRNAVPLIAGSATEIPAAGMPYHQNLEYFFATPSADLISAAETTFAWYDALQGSDRTCTMSVVKTAGIERLAQAVKAIYEVSDPGLPIDYSPQRFSYTSDANCRYFDLYDYVKALCAYNPSKTELFKEFDSAFNDVVVYEAHTPYLWNRVSLDRHNGISTFILSGAGSSSTGNYNQLKWYADVASYNDFK